MYIVNNLIKYLVSVFHINMYKVNNLIKYIVSVCQHVELGFRYFPKATSQMTSSLEATSQMCNSPSGNFPEVGFGLFWGGGVASAAARADLLRYDFGNFTYKHGPLTL